MGFFSFDKEGPGVSKDGPRKKGIFLFFELLARKFTSFLKVNMLYFLVSIPMILISFLASNFFANYIKNILGIALEGTPFIMFCQFLAATFLILLGSGPASCSLSFFYRSAVREEHVYIFSDFFGKFKSNFLQGLLVSIINTLLVFAMLFGLLFYLVEYLLTGSILWLLLILIMVIGCILLISVSFYIYQLIVTFEDSLLNHYKNSLILALINAPWNIFFILITIALNWLLFLTFTPAITLILSFIGWIGIVRFAIEFYTARNIQRQILDKIKNK